MMEYMTGQALSAAKELQPQYQVSGTDSLNFWTLQLQLSVICIDSKSQQTELILLIKEEIQPIICWSNYTITWLLW